MGHNQSFGKKGPHQLSGHLTPDLTSYSNSGTKQQQKNQKMLANQGKAISGNRGNIKPQGNIVIQQQHSVEHPSQGGGSNLIKGSSQSQANRRHNSILKGEHLNKGMIYIDKD